ncbi:hypothetical protein B484DRAFT_471037, partial [Ochromonadaceae sp. CCMP2298]
MVAAGHAYNLFCQAFLRCYFFSPWIQFVSTWMDAHRPTSAEPDLIGKYSRWIPERWHSIAEAIVKRSRAEHSHHLSIGDIILCELPDAMYYFYGHNMHLQRLFPQFLLSERIYMVHMVITVFLLRELQEGAVSLAVLVFMSQWAGCARHSELSSALDRADKSTQHHVVVAPESDLISLFSKSSRSPLGTFVMPTRDALMSTEGYNEWAKAKRNLPRGDYMAFVHVADTRLDAFPDPDTTQTFPECSVWHGQRIYADGIHLPPPATPHVYAALLRVHTWYADPEQADRLQRRATTRANGNSKLSAIEATRRTAMAPLLRQAHLHLRGDLPLRGPVGAPQVVPAVRSDYSLAQAIHSSRPPNLVMRKEPTPIEAHTITAADFAAAAASAQQSPAQSIEAEGQDIGDDADQIQGDDGEEVSVKAEGTGSGTAHNSANATPAASDDDEQPTQRQHPLTPPTPAVALPFSGGTASTANTPKRQADPQSAHNPDADAKPHGVQSHGVAGSPMQDMYQRHNDRIDELRSNTKALQFAVSESLKDAARLREMATESARLQDVRDEQQRRISEGADERHQASAQSMQLLLTSMQQLRDDTAAQNSRHTADLATMRQVAAELAEATDRKHSESLAAVTTKATYMVMEAQRLAKSQREALTEHELNPLPGSSRRAPPTAQQSHNFSDSHSGAVEPSNHNVFGSHRAEEEIALGLDVRKLYRGPTAEEWVGEDGVTVCVDPKNPPPPYLLAYGFDGLP